MHRGVHGDLQMNIPNFEDIKVVDENGKFTQAWKNIMSQLFNELQKRMSEEMHVAPSQTTANIAQFNTPDYVGGVVYNTDTKQLNANIDGTIKVIQTV